MGLQLYKKKRNFKNTPEPAGKVKASGSKLCFVVQRHDASRLHYDLRLELDGVMKSWAVPKGPSLNPHDKRLAVMVEDHPMEYNKFHGVIPKGNYGAGKVDIWDEGTYTVDPIHAKTKNEKAELRKMLEKGQLKFVMNGKHLKGSFALVRLRDAKNWLLIKHRDTYAVDEYDSEDIPPVKSHDPDKTWQSNRPNSRQKNAVAAQRIQSKTHKFTHYIKPMLATPNDAPFTDSDWIFEIKWDGYRAITEKKGKTIRFYSRNGLSFTELYPEVAEEFKKIKKDCVLDGEIVVLNEEGKPSFQKLQQFDENRTLPILYYVFDCLYYDGKDITGLPLLERKKFAQKAIPKSNVILYSDHVKEEGEKFFSEIIKIDGLEGMMAKRADSTYDEGRRTRSWLKIKLVNTLEAVIAGYTAPRESRKYFGALILGVFHKKKLRYIGHIGTGFTDKMLKELHTRLQPLVTDESPFDEHVPVNAAVTWVEPELVCNVKFSELTSDGIMRHPVFVGMRIDKDAEAVDQLDKPVKTRNQAVAKKTAVKKTPAGKSVSKKSINKNSNNIGVSKENQRLVTVDGHELKLTNQNKVFWPHEKYTKGDVITYYNKVSNYILPYLIDRPQSLKRNPQGIEDKGFYHKDAGDKAPHWVKSVEIYSESGNKTIDYILCNNKATLLYLNNLGCIEINPWNSRIQKPDNPDYLIMDIDPSDKNTFNQVIDVALVIKEILDKAGCTCYCKTSGATGMHIYIPLQGRYTYDQARPFSEIIANLTQEQLSEFTTVERPLNQRKGRIYIDFLQNRRGQTLSSVYSIRPVPGACVSTPLKWKEVKHGLSPLDFTIKTVHKRLDHVGDLFANVLTDKNDLRKCIDRLESA
jgi:bifunctional non-homologous end joining protein LigD